MPSNWLSIDSNFPSFTGEETPEQQIRMLHNYLFQLREGLQYSLQNLTADNFNTAALQNMTDAQKNEMLTQLEKVYSQLNQMTSELNRLSSRVGGVENLAGRLTAAEGEITYLGARMDSTEERVKALEESAATAEQDIVELQEHMDAAEGNIDSLAQRVTETEWEQTGLSDRVKALEDDQGLEELQKTVTGEGGIQEQLTKVQQDQEKISGVVQTADDGSSTVGAEGKVLHLVGQIYINGVLCEQGGTA